MSTTSARLLVQVLGAGMTCRVYVNIACCLSLCLPYSWRRKLDNHAQSPCTCELNASLCPAWLFSQGACAASYDVGSRPSMDRVTSSSNNSVCCVGTSESPVLTTLYAAFHRARCALYTPPHDVSTSDILRSTHYRPAAHPRRS